MPDSEIKQFTRPEALETALRFLHSGMATSSQEYVSDVPGLLEDLEWNFFDEVHRIYVHGTYDGMLKVFAGKTFSVNTVRFGRFPIFIQVANAKIGPGFFYQAMTVLGILYCHQIVTMRQMEPSKIRLTRKWITASHWIFKPLHGLFNRMLARLQEKQDKEDNYLIRQRRLDLRNAGFRFSTDDPDFVNSNDLKDHVIFPATGGEVRVKWADIVPKIGIERRIKVGALELILKRSDHSIWVWPGICPHEGAALLSAHKCDGVVQCPWHGRKFRGIEMPLGSVTNWQFLKFTVSLEGDELAVRQNDGAVSG